MLVFILYTLLTMVAAETEVTMMMSELDPPYCAVRYRRLCQGKGRHVACQFPAPGPGESCVNYTSIQFTKELRNFVTHYINRRRQRLAMGSERVRGGVHLPRPEVMMQVEWDRELALLAQRLADQCSFVHDDCRATVRFPYAGQTVGEVKWRLTSESDTQNVLRAIRRVLDAWWGERRRVTVRQLTQPFRLTNKGNVWGHFSQLAVWTLRAVGCGAVRHGDKYPKILLVCDFSHTNMLGQRTIVPGPLGPCPIHMARKQRSQYPTLCAPVRFQDEEGEDPKSNKHNPKNHETHYEDDNYDDEDLDNNISFANATLPPESNEHTARRPNIPKRMRINPWDETESGGNEISRGRDVYVKDKIHDKNIIHDDQTVKSIANKHFHSHKKMNDRTENRDKATHEETIFPESNLDGISDENTGIYQRKRIHDKGKSREKAQEHDTHLHNYDIDKIDQNLKLQQKDKINDGVRTHDFNIRRNPLKFESETTKVFKIKRIRDRERVHEKEQSLERKRLPEIEDSPHKQMSFEREHPSDYARKNPVDRPRLLEHSDREILLDIDRSSGRERPLDRERVPFRNLPQERHRQLGAVLEKENSDNKPIETEKGRPPEEDRTQDTPATGFETDFYHRREGEDNRFKQTTQRERGRYMLKLDDIQKKQRNFLDLRKGGSNRQKELHRLQEIALDNHTMELHDSHKGGHGGTTLSFEDRHPNYGSNKYRLNDFSEYGTSPRNLLESLKAVSVTGEQRRTQFYEPVGVRHRWRPTKDRPERPGARALMTNAFMYTSTRPPAPKKNSATFASITMDKDDVEQLFKDTGFNLGWKQYKNILS